jgi:hypothetical protein
MLLPVFGLSGYLHHLLRFGASPICTRCPKAARPAGTLSSQRSTLVHFVATAPLAEYLMDLRDSRLIGRDSAYHGNPVEYRHLLSYRFALSSHWWGLDP